MLSLEKIENLESEVEIYNDYIKYLNKNINELETETKNMKKIQVEEMEKNLEKENIRRDEIITKTNSLETKISKNEKSLVDYENRYKKIEKLEEEFGLYSFLTSLLNGRGKNGTDRLTIERYVQIKYFDERYSFARTKEYSGNKQIGLELDVHDTHTGKQRSVRTLSGGESFKAALALTLGLSDVVQSDSGGIDLGTIFIDEGFGSLDPESLEDAVNCLIDTKENGKTVGIISHVEGLKERVNNILKVIPTDTSSTTQFISK
jgi:exonuclease SbcC